MNLFTRIMAGMMLGSAVGLPVLASNFGWGVGSERNAKIISETSAYCPSYRRDAFGKCRRSHRSYFYGRSVMGGGPRYGK